MRKFIMVAAAAAMVAGSSVAQAAPVAEIRSGSTVAGAEEIRGNPEILLGGLALILLIIALVGIHDNDPEEGFPTSP